MTEQEPRIAIRAPREGEFFRVNADPASQEQVVLTRDEEGDLYLVAPALVPDLMQAAPERLERCVIFMAQNSDGENFLWPVTMPVPADHPAYLAMGEWVCLRGMN